MRKLVAAMLIVLAAPATAHEVWIEKDPAGPARVYLGEPAEAVPEAGDPEFSRLKEPLVFTDSRDRKAPLLRRANHIEAAVPAAGDVRLYDDAVFEPWQGEGEKWEGVVYHARAGRTETRHALELELVPTVPDGDRFTLLWQGAPVAGAKVTIIDPDRWSKAIEADDKGVVTVPRRGNGRYLLSASHDVAGERVVAGKPVTKTIHVSTLTYVVN